MRGSSAHHMHFERPFRIQRNSADVADVLCIVVDVFMSFQPWEVLEFFRASQMQNEPMNTRVNSTAEALNSPKAALMGISIGMDDLVFLEGTFRAEVLPAIRAQERTLHLMNRSDVCLNIDGLGELLVAIRAWMNHFLIVRKVHLLVNFQLLLALKPLRALFTQKRRLIRLGMQLLHVIVQRLLVRVNFIAMFASRIYDERNLNDS